MKKIVFCLFLLVGCTPIHRPTVYHPPIQKQTTQLSPQTPAAAPVKVATLKTTPAPQTPVAKTKSKAYWMLPAWMTSSKPKTTVLQSPNRYGNWKQPVPPKTSRWNKPLKMKVIPIASGKMVDQVRHLPWFTRIFVQGPVHVVLRGNAPAARVVVHGKMRSVQQIQTFVRDSTLFVHPVEDPKYLTPVTLEVDTPNIVGFKYIGAGDIDIANVNTPDFDLFIRNAYSTRIAGDHLGLHHLEVSSGSVSISGIESPELDIRVEGNADVSLRGVANVHELAFTGNSRLNCYWLKSNYLHVIGRHHAYAFLGGRVATMEATLYDHAVLDTKYLRTEEVYVKTYHQSEADLQVTDLQHTAAFNTSNIYFYKKPKFQVDFMNRSGSVLDMDGMN